MSESPSSSLASDQSLAVDLIGKIMVVIIIILFMVVVSALAIHLYAKVYRSRRTSQGQSRPHSVVALGTVTGLDPSVLNTLPVSVFQPHDSSSKENGVECSVCLSELVEGEKLRVLPKCNHAFHVDCIDMWFKSHATCPLCRTLVVAASQPQPGDLESQSFPTNVLIWGNQTQITSSSSTVATSLEESTSSNTTSSSTTSRHDMLVIDIPKQVCIVPAGSTNRFVEDSSSSSATATTSRFAEDELKSPVLRSLRSLRRLLSNNRLNPRTPTSSTQTTTKGEEGHN